MAYRALYDLTLSCTLFLLAPSLKLYIFVPFLKTHKYIPTSEPLSLQFPWLPGLSHPALPRAGSWPLLRSQFKYHLPTEVSSEHQLYPVIHIPVPCIISFICLTLPKMFLFSCSLVIFHRPFQIISFMIAETVSYSLLHSHLYNNFWHGVGP